MGFSVPAISCMLSLPSNTSLVYLKMINDVAANIQPGAAPLHRCNELCGLVWQDATVCCAMSAVTQGCLHWAAGLDAGTTPCSVTFSLVPRRRGGSEQEIILYLTSQQHVVSELIANYPQILLSITSCKTEEESWHTAEQREIAHITELPFWLIGSHSDWLGTCPK